MQIESVVIFSDFDISINDIDDSDGSCILYL